MIFRSHIGRCIDLPRHWRLEHFNLVYPTRPLAGVSTAAPAALELAPLAVMLADAGDPIRSPAVIAFLLAVLLILFFVREASPTSQPSGVSGLGIHGRSSVVI